jgi:hypothetical protein
MPFGLTSLYLTPKVFLVLSESFINCFNKMRNITSFYIKIKLYIEYSLNLPLISIFSIGQKFKIDEGSAYTY